MVMPVYKAKIGKSVWILGDYVAGTGIIYVRLGSKAVPFIINPKTVTYSIGLTDKRGALAFVGDIFEDELGKRWTIMDIVGGYGYCLAAEAKDDIVNCYPLADLKNALFLSSGTIIGNMEDNPELLK